MNPAPQIALIGATFWGNRGAEAMLCGAIGRLRERWPQATFAVFSYYPKHDEKLVADAQVRICDGRPVALLLLHFPFALLGRALRALRCPGGGRLLPCAVRVLGASDMLLDVSGISFNDERLAFLPYKVLAVWPAMLLGVPVVKLSQAMGPFRRLPNRWAARYILRRCFCSFARGRETARFLRELSLPPGRWAEAADLAVTFRPGDSLTRENPQQVNALTHTLRQRRETGETLVALSPSSLVYRKLRKRGTDYIGLLAGVMREVLEAGHTVCVLPNATRAGTNRSRNNDLFVIARLKSRVESELSPRWAANVFWVEFDLNTDGIRELIVETDVLLTSRFHAMIAGICLGVAAVAVGWSHKYKEVLEQVGAADLCIDFSEIETRLADTLRRVFERRAEIRLRLVEALPALQASAHSQFDCLAEIPG